MSASVKPPAPMSMWTVYDKPLDFPQEFVARRFEILPQGATPTAHILRADSLEALRLQAPPGLAILPRDPLDDAVIVESWI